MIRMMYLTVLLLAVCPVFHRTMGMCPPKKPHSRIVHGTSSTSSTVQNAKNVLHTKKHAASFVVASALWVAATTTTCPLPACAHQLTKQDLVEDLLVKASDEDRTKKVDLLDNERANRILWTPITTGAVGPTMTLLSNLYFAY